MDTARLEQVLEAEAQGYASFVTRLPLKTALIRRGQAQALETFLVREETEQRHLRDLERERILTAKILALALGLPGDASITQIAERLPQAKAERLGHLRDRLVELSLKLKDGNDRCELLLRASLEFVRYTMELMDGVLNPEGRLADMLYGPEPTSGSKSASILLDRTA